MKPIKNHETFLTSLNLINAEKNSHQKLQYFYMKNDEVKNGAPDRVR